MIVADARPAEAIRRLTRATVFVDGIETEYTRAGIGQPVLILLPDTPARRRMAAALASAARVVMPDRLSVPGPAGVADPALTAAWICGFLDGLGIERAGLLAGHDEALAALTILLASPDRVAGLALMPGPADGAFSGTVGIEDRLDAAARPVLLLGRTRRLRRALAFFTGLPSDRVAGSERHR